MGFKLDLVFFFVALALGTPLKHARFFPGMGRAFCANRGVSRVKCTNQPLKFGECKDRIVQKFLRIFR